MCVCGPNDDDLWTLYYNTHTPRSSEKTVCLSLRNNTYPLRNTQRKEKKKGGGNRPETERNEKKRENNVKKNKEKQGRERERKREREK
jgi:hypothetical protein